MFLSNQLDICDYFPAGINDFGLLLKGASLEKLADYNTEFNHCFIVSDFDDELTQIGGLIAGKEITHFTNRSIQARLSKDNYLKYKIRNIQLGQVFRANHFRLMQTFLCYKAMRIGLKIYSLPERLLDYHVQFGDEYALKFPNTGMLSFLYALKMIKPKRLWVFGMDFYSSPYMVDQKTQPLTIGLQQQMDKLERLNLHGWAVNIIESSPDTEVQMCSYYDGWPKIKRFRLLE